MKMLYQELGENPYKGLVYTFFLISIIPMLVLLYIFLNNRLLDIAFLPHRTQIFLLAGVIIVLGYALGYSIVRKILDKTVAYAAKSKRADELKSSFAMALAHDLKSPLGSIKIAMSSMRAGQLGRLSDEQAKAVQICDDVSDRMNSMIMELIETYMYEARATKLNISRFDLRDLVEEERRELASAASAKEIRLSMNLPDGKLIVEADRDKMVRAINNVLNNSIKYTPRGGAITVNAYPADGFVRIEFVNTGARIPRESLEKIFDKFERLDKSAEGHGLGLAIAKDIVELSRGKIWVESDPGKPTSFIILLPMVPGKEIPEARSDKRILIIEDDPAFMEALERSLTGAGYKVMTAFEADSGVASARRDAIDLIILDIGLPGKDGFFVLENLRRDPKTAGLPVIVSTSNIGPDVEKRARDKGANDFIQKPYDIEKLFVKIGAVLQ